MDSWVEEALSDSSVVAKFLMAFSQSDQEKSKVVSQPLQCPRRKRSRMITLDGIKEFKKEESRPRRASPTTPLSWSDGSSSTTTGESIRMPQARAELLSANRKRKSNSKVDISEDKKLKNTSGARKTKKKLEEQHKILAEPQSENMPSINKLKLKLKLSSTHFPNAVAAAASEIVFRVPNAVAAAASEIVFRVPDLNLPLEPEN